METYGGWCLDPRISDLGDSSKVNGQIHTPAVSPPEKSTQYSLDIKLGDAERV
jgi:hypothetical protein